LYGELQLVRPLYGELQLVRPLYSELQLVRPLYSELQLVRPLYGELGTAPLGAALGVVPPDAQRAGNARGAFGIAASHLPDLTARRIYGILANEN